MNAFQIFKTGKSLTTQAGRTQFATLYAARSIGGFLWRASTPKRIAFTVALLVGGLLLKQLKTGADKPAKAATAHKATKSVVDETADAVKKTVADAKAQVRKSTGARKQSRTAAAKTNKA